MRAPDINDFVILAGMSSLGAGLWILAPWLALVVIGILLIGLGLFGAYSKGVAAAVNKKRAGGGDQRGE